MAVSVRWSSYELISGFGYTYPLFITADPILKRVVTQLMALCGLVVA